MTTTLHNIIAADEALPALLDDDPLFMLDLPSEVVRKGKAVIRPPQLPEYVKHPAVLCIFDVKVYIYIVFRFVNIVFINFSIIKYIS